MSKPETGDPQQVVIQNRRARHEYHVLQTWEAGMVLQGTEVKSLRDSKANLQDSFARVFQGELWLYNLHISPYEQGNRFNHDPLRPRKLLLHASEVRRMASRVATEGLTLVPLDIHFTRGRAKVTLALVKGKKLHDKRDTLRERAVQRDNERGSKEQ
jgi:SsrA-binding protein